MGRGYGGGARFEWTLSLAGAGAAEMAWRSERTLRVAGAGAAEMAWEEATSEGTGWRCRNSMGGCGGGARLEDKVCLQMGPEEPNQ